MTGLGKLAVWQSLTATLLFCGACIAAESAGPAGTPAPTVERIVFSSDRSGDWRIWRVNPDGSDMVQLTEGQPDENDVDPVFSPDGKAILFTSTRGGAAGVWQMRADGKEMKRICNGDQAEWSPDGKEIAFRRDEQIVVRNLESGAERVLTTKDYAHCSGPAWSPDGRTIAFACRWEGDNALFTVPSAGGAITKVYDSEPACEPHWSPDGARLVYETESHICTVQPDGKDNRLVTYFGGVQRYGRYSPDGKQIVFCQGASERGPWELYVIPAAGGSPRRVTEEGSDMYPHWKAVPAGGTM
jgi:Tol biopolymer transport system component